MKTIICFLVLTSLVTVNCGRPNLQNQSETKTTIAVAPLLCTGPQFAVCLTALGIVSVGTTVWTISKTRSSVKLGFGSIEDKKLFIDSLKPIMNISTQNDTDTTDETKSGTNSESNHCPPDPEDPLKGLLKEFVGQDSNSAQIMRVKDTRRCIPRAPNLDDYDNMEDDPDGIIQPREKLLRW